MRAAQSQVFGYDVLDRLETASGSYGSQTYTLDANGNRLQRTGTAAQTLTYAPATNRLDTRNGLTLSHDAVGNRLNDSGNIMFGPTGELLGELVVNPDDSRTFTDWYWLNALPVARQVRVLNTAGTQVSDTRTYLLSSDTHLYALARHPDLRTSGRVRICPSANPPARPGALETSRSVHRVSIHRRHPYRLPTAFPGFSLHRVIGTPITPLTG